MKKLLGIVFLGLFWSSFSYADLTLYCKQEKRVFYDPDKGMSEIPMKQDWEIVITDNEIKVPRWPNQYFDLFRDKGSEKDHEYRGATKMVTGSNGVVSFYNSIIIDRTTGEGQALKILQGFITKEEFICSSEKIEKKNLF